MLEQIYDTLRGILFQEIPKNGSGLPVVSDQPIKDWYIGDRTVVADYPSVLFSTEDTTPKDVAFGTKELEYKVKITCFFRATKEEDTERGLQEFARLIYNALFPHRRIWVCLACTLHDDDLHNILTPEHYVAEHETLLQDYLDAAVMENETIWYETHPLSVLAPTLPDSGLGADAIGRLFEDVRNSVAVIGLSSLSQIKIQAALDKGRVPVRLLYDAIITDVKPSMSKEENAFLGEGEFILTAKELMRQPAYGPDGLPTTSWVRRI